jgi:hypothetical protein
MLINATWYFMKRRRVGVARVDRRGGGTRLRLRVYRRQGITRVRDAVDRGAAESLSKGGQRERDRCREVSAV